MTVASISRHLKNIFESSELQEKEVLTLFETTAADGKRYQTRFYNLDAIIAVGYRVNSSEATQFRIWATRTLREYIVKGFVLDDQRLKRAGHLRPGLLRRAPGADPRDPRQRAALLPEDHRPLRAGRGLRPASARDPGVLRRRAEQGETVGLVPGLTSCRATPRDAILVAMGDEERRQRAEARRARGVMTERMEGGDGPGDATRELDGMSTEERLSVMTALCFAAWRATGRPLPPQGRAHRASVPGEVYWPEHCQVARRDSDASA